MTQRTAAADIRAENERLTQAGVIALSRHREVLTLYRHLVADACGSVGVPVEPGATHAACVVALVREVRRLRALVGITSTVVVGGPVAAVERPEGPEGGAATGG